MSEHELGVQFPLVDGRRSTQRASRDVLSHAAAAVDADLAGRIDQETRWRQRYPLHVRALTARAASSEKAASAIARAGLDRLHATFEYVDVAGTRSLHEEVGSEPHEAFATSTVDGAGERVDELVVPYRGEHLRGAAIVRTAEDWAERGVVEPSFVVAIRRVVEHPGWLDLRGRTFALLGAGAEMGPTEHLLSWGAEVAAIDVPRADVWGRLERMAAGSAGRLHAPVAATGGDSAVPGADLLARPAAIRAWIESFDRPLVLGNYAYADGAAFMRVAMAADAVIVELLRTRRDLALAYLATPTDVFAVPEEAVAAARARLSEGGLATFGRVARRLTGGRAFIPNYRETVRSEDGAELGISDCLVLQQGPNYALAKRLQRWRALVARHDGLLSSVHVAPPTRTRSVLKNRVLAAAYRGAPSVGVEAFEPATSRAIMAALLVHDLQHPEAAANPGSDGAADEHVLTAEAAHGGLWRVAWEPRTALPYAVIRGAPALLGR